MYRDRVSSEFYYGSNDDHPKIVIRESPSHLPSTLEVSTSVDSSGGEDRSAKYLSEGHRKKDSLI